MEKFSWQKKYQKMKKMNLEEWVCLPLAKYENNTERREKEVILMKKWKAMMNSHFVGTRERTNGRERKKDKGTVRMGVSRDFA